MKTSPPTQRTDAPAGATVGRLRRGVVRWALAGFGVGVGSATAYLWLGGDTFWNVPRWATIVFYPGFTAGDQAYRWGLRKVGLVVVGVLAVGLAYAVLAALARCAWFAFQRRRESARAGGPSRNGGVGNASV